MVWDDEAGFRTRELIGKLSSTIDHTDQDR
jgi:hypothetical protein